MSITEDNYLQIYRGRHYSKPRLKSYTKVIAFDMDETLGSFVDLEILWRGIMEYINDNDQIDVSFYELLELFPEFLRYGIIPILEYLMVRKKENECDGLYIYTNNQCPTNWIDMISDYFNKKINPIGEQNLFDKIIYAFKVNNKIVEMARTTHEKTHEDFIKCTLLPRNTEICFIDNSVYTKMYRSRIYYIKPRAYIHSLSTGEIINRFSNSNIMSKICFNQNMKNVFIGFLWNEYNRRNLTQTRDYNYSKIEMDIVVAQKMMYHIKEFFYFTNRKHQTRKYRRLQNKFTRKK